MDWDVWLPFIGTMTGHLAWPLAAVGLGFMFREQVKKLLDKMKSLKAPGGIEASFSEEVAKVVEEAKQVQIEAVPSPEGGTKFGTPTAIQGPPPDDKDQLYELLRERPAALILDSWRDVEKLAQDVVSELGLDSGASIRRGAPMTAWPRLLHNNGVLSHEEAALLNDLRGLRNKVAHATDWEPTVADALGYHRTATLLAGVLRKKLAETKQLKQ
jgi:hypothetical protein